MVEKPDEYRWSSYKANAYGASNPIVTPHALYMALGKDRKQRARYYRESFKEVLDGKLINEIRASVQTGTPLGNERFKAELEKRNNGSSHLINVKSHGSLNICPDPSE